MATIETIDIQRSTSIPSTAPSSKKRLYIEKGDHNGLNIGLDDHSKSRPARMLREVRISGPEVLYQSTEGVSVQGTYKIEDYDSFTTYTASISAGSVSISGDTITVTSPTSAADIYLTVNGEHSKIKVRAPGVLKPSIVYPTSGLLLQNSFTAMCSVFQTSGPADVLSLVEWQAATDEAFTENLINGTESSGASYQFSGLIDNQEYYLRVRQTGVALGVSDWSTPVKATVALKQLGTNEVGFILPGTSQANTNFASSIAVDELMKTLIVGQNYATSVLTSGACFTRYEKETNWVSKQVFAPSGITATDAAGSITALSKDGEWFLIGAPGNAVKGSSAGCVYSFKNVNGAMVESLPLYASDAAANNYFGRAIAIDASGTRLMVAASGRNTNQGAIYSFKNINDVWTQDAVLVPSNSSSGDQVGFSLSMNDDGNVLIVGAAYGAPVALKTGEVHVYTRTDEVWSLEQTIHIPGMVEGCLFGYNVLCSPDGLSFFVYSKGEKIDGLTYGIVRVFEKSYGEWVVKQTLIASDAMNGQLFGDSLSIATKRDRLVIGAPGDNAQGCFYVFEKENGLWVQKSKSTPSIRESIARFGDVVVVSGDGSTVFVGAPLSSLSAAYSGRGYWFN